MSWINDEFNGITGKVLTSLAVSKDGEQTLRLGFADGSFHYVTTTGDCCSESWWADALGVATAFGGTISEVKGLDMPPLPEEGDGRTRQEIDEQYGYEIVTTRGPLILAFRNSSNGYYGGSADAATEPDGVEWQEITSDDWHS